MTLNEKMPVKNINKNPQTFLEIRPVQQEVSHSYKLQGIGVNESFQVERR